MDMTPIGDGDFALTPSQAAKLMGRKFLSAKFSYPVTMNGSHYVLSWGNLSPDEKGWILMEVQLSEQSPGGQN